MSDIYREYLLEHYHNPKNKEVMNDFDISKKDINVSCGDDVEIFIKLDTEKNKKIDERKISKVTFQGSGCVICMATSSILTEELSGKKISEVKHMNTDELLAILGLKLTPARIKCAMLPLVTMKKGIFDYESKLSDKNIKK